jgi:hypothetical protein
MPERYIYIPNQIKISGEFMPKKTNPLEINLNIIMVGIVAVVAIIAIFLMISNSNANKNVVGAATGGYNPGYPSCGAMAYDCVFNNRGCEVWVRECKIMTPADVPSADST